MKDPENSWISDLAAQPKLSAEQERQVRDWLLSHPRQELPWKNDRTLTGLLTRHRRIQTTTNFTSRVMAEATRPDPSRPAGSWVANWLPAWMPRRSYSTLTACATIALLSSLYFLAHRHQQQNQRFVADLARSAVTLRSATVLLNQPGKTASAGVRSSQIPMELASALELLRDFEAIRKLGPAPLADVELLAALR